MIDPNGPADLAPCPFCGAVDEVSFGVSHSKLFDEIRKHHHVECAGCGVMGPSRETDEEALEDWNRRALTATPPPIPSLPTSAEANTVVDGLLRDQYAKEKQGGEAQEGPGGAYWLNQATPEAKAAQHQTMAVAPAPGIREALYRLWLERVGWEHDDSVESAFLGGLDAALHPQPRPMTWTKEKPKELGYFWKRHPSIAISAETVMITRGGKVSMIREAGRNNWPLEELPEDLEWSGPIPEPQEPSAQEGGANG